MAMIYPAWEQCFYQSRIRSAPWNPGFCRDLLKEFVNFLVELLVPPAFLRKNENTGLEEGHLKIILVLSGVGIAIIKFK